MLITFHVTVEIQYGTTSFAELKSPEHYKSQVVHQKAHTRLEAYAASF